MPPSFSARCRLSLLAACSLSCAAAQWRTPVPEPQTGSTSEDGGTCPFPTGFHPLSFWTEDPLARQCRNDLVIGLPSAVDGRPITKRDFHLDQTVTTLGTIAGHKVVQVMLLIRPGPHAFIKGITADPDNPDASDTQWKTLLVQHGSGGHYLQIYGAQFSVGTFQPFKSAAIYGTGDDRILTTYEPDSGNGGGCSDGYWWFDHAGAHPVDFSPLDRAIQQKLPPNISYTGRCWALHPETNSLESGVQRSNAECHACGILGTVAATYRIHHGIAEPVSVTFTSQPEN